MGKELKYLNRKELIDIIYQLKKSEQELQASNEGLKKKLEVKRIALAEAGSVADAALALTDIFANAQASADIYLAEIAQRRDDIEREYARLIDDARKKHDLILKKAYKQRASIVEAAEKCCAGNGVEVAVKRCYEEIEHDYQLILDEAKEKAAKIIADATDQHNAIVAETNKVHRMLMRYEAEIEKKKSELSVYSD